VDRVITKGMDKALIYFSNHDFGALNSFFSLPQTEAPKLQKPCSSGGESSISKTSGFRRPEDSAG